MNPIAEKHFKITARGRTSSDMLSQKQRLQSHLRYPWLGNKTQEKDDQSLYQQLI